jgi:hypothetical protein
MSLGTVAMNLTRLVPDSPLPRCQTGVYRALEAIYNQTDWSFQKGFSGWLVPGVLFDTGSFTTTPYSNQVIADAVATAALIAYAGMPLLTNLQYRNPAYAIYDIVGYDYNTINPGFVTLTLDRPWMEPTIGSGQPFMIYQAYFVAPVQDFRKFISIQDFTNDQPIDFWSKTQADLASDDPQRQDFSIPLYCVPAGFDNRPGSSTPGWPRFELWPHQGNYCPYTLNYRRTGPLPQTQSDWQTMFPPSPITENMLEFKAKEILLLDKAADMEAKVPGSGKGMMLLSTMAQNTYFELFGNVLSIDLNLDGENFTHTHQPGKWQAGEPYATMNAGLNLGGYPSGGGV